MRHFQELMQELFQKIILMGATAESMIQLAVRSLMERNKSLQADVYAKEQQVNALQVEVDDRAVKLTALQQPMATDARFLFMASRICTELERIGDQAINICQNTEHVLGSPPLRPIVDLPIMADLAQGMVREGLRAMAQRDCALAEKVLLEEKKVDAFRDQTFRSLLTYMMADPGTIQRALSLILISRNLERIGDHATNIAEEVIYWVQGNDIRHSLGKSLDAAGSSVSVPPVPSPAESAGRPSAGEGNGGTRREVETT